MPPNPAVGVAAPSRTSPAEPRRGRFVGYYRLVEACGRPGCPLCGCLGEQARHHLAAVLAEHVTDPLTRARLAASWGFCAAHAAALREMPEAALGTAIVYQALVERATRWLDETAPTAGRAGRRRGWRALIARSPRSGAPARPRREACPVCVELRSAEERHLDALLAGLADGELGPAYAASDGVCLPHLELALTRADDLAAATRLADLARQKLRTLAEDLRRFVDKHDHRARPTFTAHEADAWRRALALVAGRAELFGPQMPREAAGGRRSRARRRRP